MRDDGCPESAEEGEECFGGKGKEERGEGAAEGLLGERTVGVPDAWGLLVSRN